MIHLFVLNFPRHSVVIIMWGPFGSVWKVDGLGKSPVLSSQRHGRYGVVALQGSGQKSSWIGRTQNVVEIEVENGMGVVKKVVEGTYEKSEESRLELNRHLNKDGCEASHKLFPMYVLISAETMPGSSLESLANH